MNEISGAQEKKLSGNNSDGNAKQWCYDKKELFYFVTLRIQIDVELSVTEVGVSHRNAQHPDQLLAFKSADEKKLTHTHKTFIKIHHHCEWMEGNANNYNADKKKCMEYECLTLFHFRLIYAINLDILLFGVSFFPHFSTFVPLSLSHFLFVATFSVSVTEITSKISKCRFEVSLCHENVTLLVSYR